MAALSTVHMHTLTESSKIRVVVALKNELTLTDHNQNLFCEVLWTNAVLTVTCSLACDAHICDMMYKSSPNQQEVDIHRNSVGRQWGWTDMRPLSSEV